MTISLDVRECHLKKDNLHRSRWGRAIKYYTATKFEIFFQGEHSSRFWMSDGTYTYPEDLKSRLRLSYKSLHLKRYSSLKKFQNPF